MPLPLQGRLQTMWISHASWHIILTPHLVLGSAFFHMLPLPSFSAKTPPATVRTPLGVRVVLLDDLVRGPHAHHAVLSAGGV